MFKISFDESLKNFNKNKFITVLSVFLFAFLFILEGYTMSYHTINENRKQSSKHESLQNWGLYCMSSQFASRMVFNAEPSLNENLDIETLEFWEKVETIENLEYLTIDDGGINITVYEELLNYPHLLDDTTNDGSEGFLSVNSMYVSPNFHKVEYYRIIEGRDFTEEDMVYVEGQPRAVLLGYKFKEVFEIGDIIELKSKSNYHLGGINEVPSLKVIGFLEEDSTVLGHSGFPIFDLDTYIIVPIIRISAEDYVNAPESLKNITSNADFMSTMLKTKFLIPEGYEAEVLPQLQEALNEYSGFSKFYDIVDKKAYVERIQERTETVTYFAASITGMLSVFAFITMMTSVVNRISRNIKDYSIHITVGATKNFVVLYVVMEMVFVMLYALVFALITLKPLMNSQGMPAMTPASWIAFGVTVLLVVSVSAIVARISMRKYDICTLIK